MANGGRPRKLRTVGTDLVRGEQAERAGSARASLTVPWVRIPLIRELALGVATQVELAERFECTQPAISRFADRYAVEIRMVRADIDSEMAGIWIAEKRYRLQSYADDVETIDSHLQDADPERVPQLLGAKHRALRNAAEELGHLRTFIDTSVSVRVEIVGVDPDQLR